MRISDQVMRGWPWLDDRTLRHPRRLKRGLFRGLFACLAMSFLTACAANLTPADGPQITASPDAQADGTATPRTQISRRGQKVKIALLLPLAGISQTAIVAKSMKQAAELALFESNNPQIQLIVKDDGGTPDGAKLAAEAAISEGAEIILGPLFAKSVEAVAGVGRSANPAVPVLAFSNDKTVAGNGAYLISFLPDPEVDRIVEFAIRQGKQRIAALIPDNAYGHRVEDAFRVATANRGAAIIAMDRYPVQNNGMLEPIQKLLEQVKQTEDAGAPIDALFVPGGPEVLPSVGPLIKFAGLDTSLIKILGTGAWDFPNLGSNKTFVGGWYASPHPAGFKAFSERFARTFGQAPPRVATLSYDAMNIAIELSNAPQGARFTEAQLTRPGGFNGADGPLRLRPDGAAERTLAVLEVQRFGTRTLETTPGTAPAAYRPAGPLETGSNGSEPATQQPSMIPRDDVNGLSDRTGSAARAAASRYPQSRAQAF